MPGAEWFPGARLNFAEHVFRSRDPDTVAIRHASELRPLAETTWGELEEDTRRLAASLRASGVGRGDRRRGVPPEHRGGRGRVPGMCEPRRDLVQLLAGLRRAQRRRPFRTDRAARAPGGRRVSLRRPRPRPARRPGTAPGVAADARAHDRPRLPPPRADPRRPRRRDPVGGLRAGGGRRGAHVRAGRVRRPAVGALQLGDDRAAEGDRARARRDPAGVPQGAQPPRRPARRRPALLVHDHRLDDVELPRRGAPHGGVGGALRRQSRLSRPRHALGPRRGGRDHVLRDVGELHRRLPEGRSRSAGGARPVACPCGRLDRLAALPGGLRLGLRLARAPTCGSSRPRAGPTSAPRSSGACPRCPSTAASSRHVLSAPRSRRGTATASRWSARSGSSCSRSRCPRCRSASGATTTAPATARATSRRTPGSGGTATGSRSPSAGRRSSRGAPTRRSTGAACGWGRRRSTVPSSRWTRSSTRSSSICPVRERRATCRCSSCCATAPSSTSR